jgi:hypothetical protein
MAESQKSWSIQAQALSFGLVPCPGGAGEGGFIEFEQKKSFFTTIEGVDGTAVRYNTGTRLWTVKIKLLATASYNDYLAGIHVADVASVINGGSGVGVLPLGWKDLGGNGAFTSPRAWITKWPKADVRDKVTDREWELDAADCDVFLGGTFP